MEYLSKFVRELRKMAGEIPRWRFIAIWIPCVLLAFGFATKQAAKLLGALATLFP